MENSIVDIASVAGGGGAVGGVTWFFMKKAIEDVKDCLNEISKKQAVHSVKIDGLKEDIDEIKTDLRNNHYE